MANSYLYRTNGTPTSAYKGTVSHWIKRSIVGVSEGSYGTFGVFNNGGAAADRGHCNIYNDTIYFYNQQTSTVIQTNRKFRDTNGWYHIVIAWDTTQATASNRVKIYVNGEQETSFSTATYPGQNNTMEFNVSGRRFAVGALGSNGNAAYFWDGYQSHFAFVDGQQLTPTSFGETDSTSGIWKFKSPSGVTWGNNGFHLKFENSGALGTDSSGNGNNLTVSGNLKQALDTPSNVYATANRLTLSVSQFTLINGNLSINGNASNAWRSLYGTLGVSSGKWYWEVKVDAINSSDPNNIMLGVLDADQMVNTSNNGNPSGLSRGYQYHAQAGNKINNGSSSSYGAVYTAGDIIGIALDLDNHKLYFHKNGTYQNSGDPTSGATGTGSAFDLSTGYTYVPTFAQYYSAEKWSANFGNGFFGTTAITSAGSNGNGSLFEYDVPSGYYALNTKNINTYG